MTSDSWNPSLGWIWYLAEAEKGPYYGPFKSGAEVAAFLKKWKAKGAPAKLKKTG